MRGEGKTKDREEGRKRHVAKRENRGYISGGYPDQSFRDFSASSLSIGVFYRYELKKKLSRFLRLWNDGMFGQDMYVLHGGCCLEVVIALSLN